ncbi:hypothetical protein DAI22_04g156100 [Oryza sativa Japonica Group]|nr:hypothetical protein DAI22_04g156100 [Oryza sativa Japonica Group]
MVSPPVKISPIHLPIRRLPISRTRPLRVFASLLDRQSMQEAQAQPTRPLAGDRRWRVGGRYTCRGAPQQRPPSENGAGGDVAAGAPLVRRIFYYSPGNPTPLGVGAPALLWGLSLSLFIYKEHHHHHTLRRIRPNPAQNPSSPPPPRGGRRLRVVLSEPPLA